MMASYMNLDKFKAIYVVDLCGPLCKQVCWQEVGTPWWLAGAPLY